MRRKTSDIIAVTVGVIILTFIACVICWVAGYRATKGAEINVKPAISASSSNLQITGTLSNIGTAKNVEERIRREEEIRLGEEARRIREDSRTAGPGADPGSVTVERTYSVEECRGIGHRLCISTWSEAEWPALDELWGFRADGSVLESGWDPLAHNSSDAHGIPQACPGSKMASEGADWYWNPETQIRWGCRYILGRYGTPTEALRFRLANGWY